jgi:hypothetical protein
MHPVQPMLSKVLTRSDFLMRVNGVLLRDATPRAFVQQLAVAPAAAGKR